MSDPFYPSDEEFLTWLKTLIPEPFATPAALARAVGIMPGTVRQWLKGRYLPRPHSIRNVIAVLASKGIPGPGVAMVGPVKHQGESWVPATPEEAAQVRQAIAGPTAREQQLMDESRQLAERCADLEGERRTLATRVQRLEHVLADIILETYEDDD